MYSEFRLMMREAEAERRNRDSATYSSSPSSGPGALFGAILFFGALFGIRYFFDVVAWLWAHFPAVSMSWLPWGQIALAICVLIAAFVLFLFREFFRAGYALLELGSAVGTALEAYNRDGSSVGNWGLTLAVLGAVYIAVRGFSNLEESWHFLDLLFPAHTRKKVEMLAAEANKAVTTK